MKTYIGKEGLSMSWQENFPKSVKCHKCKGNCRVMFVAQEGFGGKSQYICDLHNNTGGKKGGKFWLHDVMACAVYLCEKCFKPNAVLNQA